MPIVNARRTSLVLLLSLAGVSALRAQQPAAAEATAGSTRPGYPEIVVPIGTVQGGGGGGTNPYPAGFVPNPAPYSAAFVGMPCSEPTLISIAYAFEQLTKRRVPPPDIKR